MKRYFLIFLTAVVIGCGDLKPAEVNLYFDLNDLLNQQIKTLSGSEVHKMALVNSDTAITSLKLDSLGWADEFNIFREADINKPALRGLYELKEYNDTNSNLKVLEYQAINEAPVVRSLKLYYWNSIDKLKKIEASIVENNSIFDSEKQMKLTFDEINKQMILMNYYASGYQKMLFQDSVIFEINGKLQH